MRGKVGLLVGLGVGWVLGTRYGRQGYDDLKRKAKDVVNDPRVQRGAREAERFVADNVPVVGEKVAGVMGRAREAVSEPGGSTAAGATASGATQTGAPSGPTPVPTDDRP